MFYDRLVNRLTWLRNGETTLQSYIIILKGANCFGA